MSLAAEPITPDPPELRGPTLLSQSWLDAAFLHWEAATDAVAGLLPPGTEPDTFEGRTYVGLVAFRMHRIGWLGLPGLPYLGTFPETNVRLYSVDGQGRRGVVFRSLDASRLLPVLVARSAFRLPYAWSRMGVRRAGSTVSYVSRRRLFDGPGAVCDLEVAIGEPLSEPSFLEHFLTARWGLHCTLRGRLAYLPNAHPRWPLHRARVLSLREDLVAHAGLPAPTGDPVSVLWSPGVPVRFGRPRGDLVT